MRQFWIAAAFLTAALPANGGEWVERLPQMLYDGVLRDAMTDVATACDAEDAEACFALGLGELIAAYEETAQALYRHGATVPTSPTLALLLGTGLDAPSGPANPDPEALTYEGLVAILESFSGKLGAARGHFETAGNGDAFVILIDPLRVRLDLDGDGTAGAGETLAVVLNSAGEFAQIPATDRKTKSKGRVPDTSIGLDNADAIWLAGYSTIVSTPVEFLLAHDFSEFFAAYLHRVFPEAGLPMEDFTRRAPAGVDDDAFFMDSESDAFIADVIAAIHTARFPVINAARLAEVRTRLLAVTALSRRNWELILAETDDNRELVPSPQQTSLVPDRAVTAEVVDAWLATLDTVDGVLEGDLLLPHWRFEQGIDLKAFFETATETDIVMLLTGQGAVPFLSDGPVADVESFAEANRVFGDDWPLFALWFN